MARRKKEEPIEESSEAISLITPDNNTKTVDVQSSKKVNEKISDIKTYGDPDTFRLLCKSSSENEGWMKSTKYCNVRGGCVLQTETQQRNPDGSYILSQALVYVPNAQVHEGVVPKFGPIITK
jgi:S-adenosylmethionine hydrolase